MTEPYPEGPRERDRWILARRQGVPRAALDPWRPYEFLTEDERSHSGEVVPVATIFLTNRECPWRCLMCDLWRNTTEESVPPGAIPAQIEHALARLMPARQVKLYNSGSFFDPRAIPEEDYAAIARQVLGFERVIVESHPSLVGERTLRLRDLLSESQTLEVAMGLETIHPVVGPKLNKRATPEQFARAAEFLRQNGIALRVFILVKPPFLDEAEALEWACRSLDFAFDCGASVAALIPTRAGNGALEALAQRGEFSPPQLSTLEAAFDYGIGLERGRVLADLWDLQKFSRCEACFEARQSRLARTNLSQVLEAPIRCANCGSGR